jgi:hypothetical protein
VSRALPCPADVVVVCFKVQCVVCIECSHEPTATHTHFANTVNTITTDTSCYACSSSSSSCSYTGDSCTVSKVHQCLLLCGTRTCMRAKRLKRTHSQAAIKYALMLLPKQAHTHVHRVKHVTASCNCASMCISAAALTCTALMTLALTAAAAALFLPLFKPSRCSSSANAIARLPPALSPAIATRVMSPPI